MYYQEIIAPNLKQVFMDDDFNKGAKMYLVKANTLYPELIACFNANTCVTIYKEGE